MIYILVPYRNRETQLELFTKYTKYLFLTNNINVEIIICNQDNDKPFNRGLLINYGFLWLIKNRNMTINDTIIVNDVDCLCLDKNIQNLTKYPNNRIRHLYGYNHLFHNYFYSLGGIISFSPHTFLNINGFPNNFWGWGAEDLALGNRAKLCKINIDNTDLIPLGENGIFQLNNPNSEPNLMEKLKNNSNNLALLIEECKNPNLIKENGVLNLNTNFEVKENNERDYIMLSFQNI
jgi:hypothetical protein